jgi:hypothetical protein
MARRVSDERQRDAALQAARRMVARGDRPAYRVRMAQDGRWLVDALPWLPLAATSRREALDEARAAIAAWLEVDVAAFDLET